MNKLYEMFHPEIKLMDKRLSGNSPCVDCENIHRFTRGTAWEETQIDPNKCNSCMDKLLYKMDCMDKLRWYEDNDEKVNKFEQKDRNKYDCGVKCPGTLSDDGYLILYPDGWAKEENMEDFKVVWQRDMNIAYNQALEDLKFNLEEEKKTYAYNGYSLNTDKWLDDYLKLKLDQ